MIPAPCQPSGPNVRPSAGFSKAAAMSCGATPQRSERRQVIKHPRGRSSPILPKVPGNAGRWRAHPTSPRCFGRRSAAQLWARCCAPFVVDDDRVRGRSRTAIAHRVFAGSREIEPPDHESPGSMPNGARLATVARKERRPVRRPIAFGGAVRRHCLDRIAETDPGFIALLESCACMGAHLHHEFYGCSERFARPRSDGHRYRDRRRFDEALRAMARDPRTSG